MIRSPRQLTSPFRKIASCREWLLFERIDVDGDGELTKEEVEAFFVARGMGNVAKELMTTIDTNGDGVIDFGEFVGGYMMFKNAMEKQWQAYEDGGTAQPATAPAEPASSPSLAPAAAEGAAAEPEPEPAAAAAES
eukprot:SAG22_NODE_1058_length_5769_cov_6.433510_9_plen_136_part_00